MQARGVGHTLGAPYARAVKTRALLVCGAIAGPVFTAAWIIEGTTRSGYNPLRHPISSLSIGDLGWTQIATFVVAGLLSLAFAVGLRPALRPRGGSTWGPLLVGAFAIGLIGAGIFVSDPLNGYPPGTPNQPQQYSMHGALHQLLSTLVFVGLPAACFVFARRFTVWGDRGWAIYSVTSGVVFAVAFVLTSLGFAQTSGFADIAGLLQRVTITVGWTWLTLLAVHLLQVPSEAPTTD